MFDQICFTSGIFLCGLSNSISFGTPQRNIHNDIGSQGVLTLCDVSENFGICMFLCSGDKGTLHYHFWSLLDTFFRGDSNDVAFGILFHNIDMSVSLQDALLLYVSSMLTFAGTFLHTDDMGKILLQHIHLLRDIFLCGCSTDLVLGTLLRNVCS